MVEARLEVGVLCMETPLSSRLPRIVQPKSSPMFFTPRLSEGGLISTEESRVAESPFRRDEVH